MSVAISTTTSGATIHYTTDGSTPTTSSPVYSSPIAITQTTTVRAMAAASGMANSAVASASYTINQQTVATPTFNPPAGTYSSSVSVAISTTTSGATIYYTTDGSTPTTSSPVYTSPIAITQTTTVRAMAAASGMANSAVASASYTINQQTVATPTFNPPAGTYSSIGVGGDQHDDQRRHDLLHHRWQHADDLLAGLHQPDCDHADDDSQSDGGRERDGQQRRCQRELHDQPANRRDADLQPAGRHIRRLGGGHHQHHDQRRDHPLHDQRHRADDGVAGLQQSRHAHANHDDPGDRGRERHGQQRRGERDYTIQPPVATPTFTPPAGTYVGSVAVTISTTTGGATIHYTTNGTAPTTASPVYSAPVALTQTTTIRAIAVASGMANSAEASATYTIQQAVATPTFTPPAGTYVGSVAVTISTTTGGATIHYTTNGTAPTTASPVYSGPVTLTQTTTIRAIAVASGMANSAEASATYTVQAVPPVFNPVAEPTRSRSR